MNRGPRSHQPSKHDFVARARAAWGTAMPDWVLVLAEQASATSGRVAAEKIGYSAAVVSHVLAKTYPGDIARVEEKVRGALMGLKVTCPVLGEIGRDRCLDEQKKTFSATSSVRSRLWRACRSGCPHSRITVRENNDAA